MINAGAGYVEGLSVVKSKITCVVDKNTILGSKTVRTTEGVILKAVGNV
jgi:hypothetical protein